MDCVTCLLVGMCMLCGQNLGGSRESSLSISEAANPGRPMTRAEVDTALQSAIRNLNGNANSNSNSYLRQSKLDPRFSHMGIGKRYETKLDPFNFVAGLGKRNQVHEEDQGDTVLVVEDPGSMGDDVRTQGKLRSSGDNNAFNLRSVSQEASPSYTDTNPFIFSHIIERNRRFSAPSNRVTSSGDTRQLRLRRMQLRLEPVLLLNGAESQM